MEVLIFMLVLWGLIQLWLKRYLTENENHKKYSSFFKWVEFLHFVGVIWYISLWLVRPSWCLRLLRMVALWYVRFFFVALCRADERGF